MNILSFFLSKESLEFYVNARQTHKQLLTVLNPYDNSINFKVLCTSPTMFSVIDPEGVITPRSCIDLIFLYTQPSVSHCDTVSKFRITVFDNNTQQALGHKDILIKVIEGEPPLRHQESFGDNFLPIAVKDTPFVRPTSEEHSQVTTSHHKTHREPQQGNLMAVAVSICCIAALLLPTQPECILKTQWPDWLHISSNLKIVFSFVLGLVCMLVLRL